MESVTGVIIPKYPPFTLWLLYEIFMECLSDSIRIDAQKCLGFIDSFTDLCYHEHKYFGDFWTPPPFLNNNFLCLENWQNWLK